MKTRYGWKVTNKDGAVTGIGSAETEEQAVKAAEARSSNVLDTIEITPIITPSNPRDMIATEEIEKLLQDNCLEKLFSYKFSTVSIVSHVVKKHGVPTLICVKEDCEPYSYDDDEPECSQLLYCFIYNNFIVVEGYDGEYYASDTFPINPTLEIRINSL